MKPQWKPHTLSSAAKLTRLIFLTEDRSQAWQGQCSVDSLLMASGLLRPIDPFAEGASNRPQGRRGGVQGSLEGGCYGISGNAKFEQQWSIQAGHQLEYR